MKKNWQEGMSLEELYYVYLTTISDENYSYDHIVLDEINLSELKLVLYKLASI